MKAFAIVLLCALAAVQGRYTALQSTRTAAALGDNPWFVHLRIAVSTSGLLNTGAGSLIDNRWVLTSAANVVNVRFIWARFGFEKVINPSLVIESTAVRVHPEYNAATGENNIALISVNRYIETTPNIAPISIVGVASELATFCNVGGDDAPGEVLFCYEVNVQKNEDGSLTVTSEEVQATAFDNGAPLVSNGAQVGLLVEAGSEGSVGKFQSTAPYQEWIGQETGLFLNSEAVAEVAPEAVRFVQ